MDCVPFESLHLQRADTTVDVVPLSTPPLSSPSLSSGSSSDESFFSAASSDGGKAFRDGVGSPIIVDPKATSPGLSGHFGPALTLLAPFTAERKQSKAKPPPLAMESLVVPSLKTPQQPRKLRKSPPAALPLSPSSLPSSPGPGVRVKSPLPPRGGKLRRATTQVNDFPTRRNRRGSLPTVPSATLWKQEESPEESHGDDKSVSFDASTNAKNTRTKEATGFRSPHPSRINRDRNTDALAAFAWTGQFPSSVTPSFYSFSGVGDRFILPSLASASIRQGNKSTWSLTEQDEDDDDGSASATLSLGSHSPIAPISSSRDLIRRQRPCRNHKRRWTLAMAITDDEISDEALVDQLEQMRSRDRTWLSPISPTSPTTPTAALPTSTSSTFAVENGMVESPEDEQPPVLLKPSLPSLCTPGLSSTWHTARRALLICRELVRTERHYLSSLFTLISGDIDGEPSCLMRTYLPALVDASEALLSKMEGNPSAQGVASAFIEEEQKLESAFVAWSGVAGDFFADTDEPDSKSSSGSISSFKEAAQSTTKKKRNNSWSKRIRSLSNGGVSKLTPLASPRPPSAKPPSKPAVRDLAIAPTQRVVRYVLLFKDLLAHTPKPSSSQGSVEIALHAALSIAGKCDRAQGNAAFLRSSS